MARWARKLLDQFHIDAVDVMGVSWGGALAQQFAFQYRNRVGNRITSYNVCYTKLLRMIVDSCRAVLHNDLELAAEVIDRDPQVDRMEAEVERQIVT